MSDPRQETDELELKKRARRRLVGAVAFASFAAVVLPMVMDETPPPSGRDIELRIPGQDQLSSSPVTSAKPAAGAEAPKAPLQASAAPAPSPASAPAPAVVPVPAVLPKPPVAEAAKTPNKAVEVAKPTAPKAAEAAKPAPVKPPEALKPAAPAKKEVAPDAKRAQAILDGQGGGDAGGAQVILIGAFANQANVKNIQTKLGQLGIKTYTENLDSPQGRKTRVRAGPFANREAAEKALEKMKRIGVNGVVAPKQ